jgi:hypothetical protein
MDPGRQFCGTHTNGRPRSRAAQSLVVQNTPPKGRRALVWNTLKQLVSNGEPLAHRRSKTVGSTIHLSEK